MLPPQDYLPNFDASYYKYIMTPDGEESQGAINEIYCLRPKSAQKLVEVLSDNYSLEVYQAFPLGDLGNVLQGGPNNGKVPWLKITKKGLFSKSLAAATIQVNAGIIANYYNHSVPAPGMPPITPAQAAQIQIFYDGLCRQDLNAQLAAATPSA
jgi:hypothetical protein